MNFKQKITAGFVLALTALNPGSASAYIPLDAGFNIASSLVTLATQSPLERLEKTDNFSHVPTPAIPSIFLRSEDVPRFQTATQTADAGPLGFQIFCLQNPDECKAGEDIQVTYDSKMGLKLSQVNLAVNSSIVGRNDVGIDQWNVNTTEGDCEEYVLTKRFQLAAAGLPIGALRIVTARTLEGIGHAVLVVRTDQGDLVLDNLNNTVKPWDEVTHELLSVSGANPNQWYPLA